MAIFGKILDNMRGFAANLQRSNVHLKASAGVLQQETGVAGTISI